MTKISRERAFGLVKDWSAKRNHISVAFVLAGGFGFMAGKLSVAVELDTGIALIRADDPKSAPASVYVIVDFARAKAAFLATREEMAQETLAISGSDIKTSASPVGSCVRLELPDSDVVLFLWEDRD